MGNSTRLPRSTTLIYSLYWCSLKHSRKFVTKTPEAFNIFEWSSLWCTKRHTEAPEVKKKGCEGAVEVRQGEPDAYSHCLHPREQQPSMSFPATSLQSLWGPYLLRPFHRTYEGLVTNEYPPRAARPKHELRRDTRGPSAPKCVLTPLWEKNICSKQRQEHLPCIWH